MNTVFREGICERGWNTPKREQGPEQTEGAVELTQGALGETNPICT